MIIIDQSLDHIAVYTGHDTQLRKKIRYDSLADVMMSMKKEFEQKTSLTFLLDEQLFSYHAIDMHISAQEPCSIAYIKGLIDEKIRHVGDASGAHTSYITHRISHILVNGEPKLHVLGHRGNITFSLELCLLTPAGISMGELLSDKVFEKKFVEFYPRNYYTLAYLKSHLKHDKYAFLLVEQEMTQLICVENGWYTDVQYINIGIQLLKSCYKEHDIEKYFYIARDEVEQNHFLSKIVDEALSFFTNMLAKWLVTYIDTNIPLVVAGDVIQNPSFLPVFQDSYRAYGTGYIVPLQALQHTSFAYEFCAREITVASYLHYK